MKWIKASERLPEHGDLYFVKMVMKDSGLPWFPDTCNYYDEWQDVGEDYEVLEWLDESPSAEVKEQQGVDWKQEYDAAINEIGQLQEQLKEAENEIRQLHNELNNQ